MAPNAPIRRRRGLILGGIILALIFIFYVPWELPASVKDRGLPNLSRANVAQLVKTSKVDEIYGLLHLVTGTKDNGRALNSVPNLDVTEPLDWSIYAAGPGDSGAKLSKTADKVNAVHPIVVFSKTYCPYSMRAKQLLESYAITPPPKVVEVDIREDGHHIKGLLGRLTGHSTFPNVIFKGKSIGGSDNLQALHAQGKLVALIESSGSKVGVKPSK